jgi:sugar phosphate isomerase/epimerase
MIGPVHGVHSAGGIMIGVSPAYFISRYGSGFGPDDIATGLPDLAEMGYTAFQIESYYLDRVGEWSNGGLARVCDAADRHGLVISQFVGHCLLNGFIDDASLFDDTGVPELREIASMLPPDRCPLITVPLPTFQFGSAFDVSRSRVLDRLARVHEKLSAMARIVLERGLRMAVEIVPGAIIGDLVEAVRLLEAIEGELEDARVPRVRSAAPLLGVNFDTGHAWAQKRLVHVLPGLLGERIFGTHLCDNFGHENLSLAPGEGSLDWALLLRGLISNGYAGSLDVEIHCPADQTDHRYRAALTFLESHMAAISDDA